MSGLLVTDSLLSHQSALKFVVGRFFRIWPALALVLLSTIFLIGPASTTLDLTNYFSTPETFLYFKHQMLMQTWGTQSLGYYDLPGVFTDNLHKKTTNASLWSLFAEVFAYLCLAAVFLVGLLGKRAATLLVAIIALDSITPNRILFTFLPQGNEDFSYLPFCFASGVFFALYKEKIWISARLPAGFALLTYLFKNEPNACHLFYLTVFTLALYVATRPWVIQSLRLPFDISYGTFLWGFPIQQCLAQWLPGVNGFLHCALAMLLASIAGTMSWLLVEKRSIRFGKRVAATLGRFHAFPVTIPPRSTL